MIRLIKTEFKKIFHKKSFYVVTFLFILYALLTNFINQDINNYDINSERLEIKDIEEEISVLDPNNPEELSTYIYDLAIIDTGKLDIKLKTSNQIYLNHTYLQPLVEEIYENKYSLKNDEKTEELETKKNIILAKIEADDYKYFVNNKIKDLKIKIDSAKDNETKERLNIYLTLAEYRLNNNIPFDSNNYLNNALNDIEINLIEYRNLKNKNNLTKVEKESLETLNSIMLKSRYILENKEDINNPGTLRAILKNFNGEFQIFILIYIVMICGSIVSEEFNKGTIKYLLTKPYKRRTILTSKLLTVLLLIPIIIIGMILIEVLIGGLILGFDSLKVPIVIYNSSKNLLVSYSCFYYLFLMLLASFPAYLVLSILCFSLSTITCSTSAAITITFLFYFVSEVIKNLALIYNIKILKAFISLHWDFTYIINCQNNPFKFNLVTSISVVLIYISVILCLTYIYFHKKDVKNI